jgi:radical SAM superfamily enzyme YgiQ (UPF0313 family)
MKKVLLFNPRATTYAKLIPNSILAVASSIEGIFEYVIVDGNKERDPFQVIRMHLESGNFGYFASTVMPGPQLKQAIPFTKEIRKRYPEVKTIWGGYFAYNQYRAVLNSGVVDVVVNGPGEKAFPQLLHAFEENKSFADIENIIFKNENAIIKNPIAPLFDPDTLPPLPYEKLNTFYPIEAYLGKTFLGTKTISYHSSMGCPFTCSFCGVVPIFEARWRGKSPANMVRDIKYLKNQYGGNAVLFHDNNFFVSEKRTVEFAKLIQKEKMSWWGEGRIDTVDKFADESLQIMADSGCKMIFFGAESGNDSLLHDMDKGGTQTGEMIKAFAGRMKKFKIIPEYSFVLGLPAPTEKQVWSQINFDIKFIKDIKRINPDTEIIIYIYSPVPTEGSELFHTVTRQGFRYPETLDDWLDPSWMDFDLHRNPLTPWMTSKMVRRIHDFETVLNAYYPTVSDYKLTRLKKQLIRRFSSFRYHKNVFTFPYELKILQKYWLKYRRPENEGF